MRRRCVMLGPSPTTRGGMASVIANYLEGGYCANGSCLFVPTHVDGSRLRKAWVAAAAAARLLLLLLSRQVDLVHVHVASGVSFWRKSVFIRMASLFGRPVIFHLHGGEFTTFVERRLRGWRQKVALRLMKRTALALCWNSEAKRWLQNVAGIPDVRVFPNPVAVPAEFPAADRSGVLFVGRVTTSKGIDDLIRAFALIRADCPDVRLVVCGDGDLSRVKILAAESGLSDNISFLGWVDAQERNRLLRSVAVYAMPSHIESGPMTVLEAMAAGAPVVATRVGAVPDMIVDGESGLTVNTGDVNGLAVAIRTLLKDSDLASVMARKAHAHVLRDYSTAAVLTSLQRRYDEVGTC